MPTQEVEVQHRAGFAALHLQELLHHRLEQRHVAAHPDLHVEVRNFPATLEHPDRVLGVSEAHQRGLTQRIDADDARAPGLGLEQRGKHARVVAARVLADHEDGVGLLEVCEAHRALAHADGVGQCGATRLVTEIGTVRQVVGAELAAKSCHRNAASLLVRPDV